MNSVAPGGWRKHGSAATITHSRKAHSEDRGQCRLARVWRVTPVSMRLTSATACIATGFRYSE